MPEAFINSRSASGKRLRSYLPRVIVTIVARGKIPTISIIQHQIVIRQEDGMFGLTTENANSVANWTYLIAGALAVFFTATTVVAGYVIWRTSAEISAAKDRELVMFQTDASKRQASLEKEASDAKERTEQLRLQSLKLQQRLEEERLSRLNLQKALSSRHLSPEAADRLSDAVRGRLAQVVLRYVSDAETLAFAQDIANALTRGGVQVIPAGMGMMLPKPYGVTVSTSDPASPLVEGLTAADVVFQFNQNEASQPSILVGEKPPGL